MAYSRPLAQSRLSLSSHSMSSPVSLFFLTLSLSSIFSFSLSFTHTPSTFYHSTCFDHLDSEDANVDAALPAAHDEDLQMKDLLCLLRLANR
jgi:hypothetical protein